MSYSRWMFSEWYAYPCGDEKCIICHHIEGECFKWKSDETFDHFIERVGLIICESDTEQLQEILSENMNDIKSYFKKWKSKK